MSKTDPETLCIGGWASLVAQMVNNPLQYRRPGFVRSGRSSGGRRGNPLQLPGESHGQRSLAGYSPQGRKESDMTEATEHIHIVHF